MASLMDYATIGIMFGSNDRKMARIKKLLEKNEAWEKYNKAHEQLLKITGLRL